MISANDVDSRLVSLRISGTSPQQYHTLKDKLLENAKDYTCIVRDFFVNSFPPMFADTRCLMMVGEKDDYNVAMFLPDFDDIDNPDQFMLVLQREHHKNILSVIQYIHQWCVDINRKIAVEGSVLGGDPTFHIASKVVNPNLPYDTVESDEHIKFSFDTTGRARITVTDAFLSQFYLAIHPDISG